MTEDVAELQAEVRRLQQAVRDRDLIIAQLRNPRPGTLPEREPSMPGRADDAILHDASTAERVRPPSLQRAVR